MSGASARRRGAAPLHLPGPPGRRLVGTLYDYEKDPAGYLTRCRDTYGDIFALTPQHVVLCRPDWSQRVFARTNREFRFASGEISCRESFMTRQVAGWMLARRSAGWHRLGGQNTAATGALMRHRLSGAIAQMAAVRVAGVADCQRAATEAALHIFVAEADEHLRQLVVDAAAAIPAVTSSSLTVPRLLSPSRRRFTRATDALIEELTRLAAHRVDTGDILGLLSRAMDQAGTEHAFSSTQVAQYLASGMTNVYAVAGAALSWLMVVAGLYPSSIRPDNALWAEAVVKETLRMYPPIWGVGRRVKEPVEIGGYLLRPGMSILMSPLLMHLDRRWWREDPASFRPERWLDPTVPPYDNHAYIPYGSGPRVCVGAQIAQTLLIHAFDILASSWQVRTDPQVPVPAPGAVVVPDPLRMTLTPR